MGVKLSIREVVSNPLYSCRSVEYKWKNNSKWGNKHLNCTLKKSLRIPSTDSEIMNHIILIIKESKRVRENFKVKTLNPKFDEVKNIKKEKDKRVKYIKEKNKIYKGYSDNVIDIEVDILTSQIDKDRKMITKISDMMNEVSSEINRLERELSMRILVTGWIG